MCTYNVKSLACGIIPTLHFKVKFLVRSYISITRGHDYKIFKLHAQRPARSHYFSVRVINHWNNLPSDTANAPSINIFKKNLIVTLMYVVN